MVVRVVPVHLPVLQMSVVFAEASLAVPLVERDDLGCPEELVRGAAGL